jgi:hypothetical protein
MALLVGSCCSRRQNPPQELFLLNHAALLQALSVLTHRNFLLDLYGYTG